MSKPIDSEEEYERRRALLEKHEEADRKELRKIIYKSFIPDPISVSEIADHIIDKVTDD